MNFSQKAYEIIDNYEIDYDLSFEKFIYLSYAIQFIINQDSQSDFDILNSNFAFYDYQKEDKNTSQELSESDKGIIRMLINKISLKEITSIVSQDKNISKKEIYNYCLKLKNEN